MPPTDIFHFSEKKSTFEVDIFISHDVLLFIWDVCKTPALSFFTSEVSKKEDRVGAILSRHFMFELPRRATTNQMSAQECSEA